MNTTTLTTTPSSAAHGTFVPRTPGSVTAARVVLVLHGLVLGGLGALMMNTPEIPSWLVMATAGEGLLRIVLAAALRRGARRTRSAAIVLAVIGAVIAGLNMPLGIIGIALNGAVVRCLQTEAAKDHFAG